MKNIKDQACQGCDQIEAPILDAGAQYFKEQLKKKYQSKDTDKKEVEELKLDE